MGNVVQDGAEEQVGFVGMSILGTNCFPCAPAACADFHPQAHHRQHAAHFLSMLPPESQETEPVLIASIHSVSSVESKEGYLLHRCSPDEYHDSILRLQL